MVSILVHGHDPGRFYRRACGMVCHGNRQAALYNLGRHAIGGGRLAGAGPPIAISLAAFVLTYAVVFGAGSYYIMKLIRKGPDTEADVYGSHGVKEPPLITGFVSEEEGQHV